MKKLLIVLSFMLGFAGIASAQQVEKKPMPKLTKIERVKKVNTVVKEGEAPRKADGTLDKRYKINKEKKVIARKVKKDGTPDMRYNENKKTKN